MDALYWRLTLSALGHTAPNSITPGVQGRAKKVVQAQKLWFAVLEAQIETGNPYILFKVNTCLRA